MLVCDVTGRQGVRKNVGDLDDRRAVHLLWELRLLELQEWTRLDR